MDLKNIQTAIPDCILDLRYAGTNNILGKQLYPSGYDAQLTKSALDALSQAADEFRKDNYQLVVWDAFRLPEVQQQLRAVCEDERYVAVDSNHLKGITVDLTLARAGKNLDMGTDHDEFGEKAHSDFQALTDTQLQNRQLLANVMRKHGFRQLPYEWWHFDFVGGEDV